MATFNPFEKAFWLNPGGAVGFQSVGPQGQVVNPGGVNLNDPGTAAMLGLAGGLLQAGGWSPVPVSMGQALGAGLQGGMQSYRDAVIAQRAAQQQRLEEGLQNMQKARLEAQERVLANLPPEEQDRARAMGFDAWQASTAAPKPLSSVGKIQRDFEAGLLTPAQYEAAVKKATTGQPLVNLTQGYTAEQVKKMAASDVGYRDTLRSEAAAARKKIPQLRRTMSLIESGDFETGALAQPKLFLGRVARSLGLDPEAYNLGNIETGEQLQASFNRMVMDSLDAFVGTLSEKELAFAERATAGLGQSPETNKALVQMAINAAERQRGIYRKYREWVRKYGAPDVLNEDGIDFEMSIDQWVEEQGESVELPDVTPTEAAPATVEAGMVGGEPAVTGPVTITPDTDLTALTEDQLLGVDVGTMGAEDLQRWLDELSRRGL